jgi:hypothetical protein
MVPFIERVPLICAAAISGEQKSRPKPGLSWGFPMRRYRAAGGHGGQGTLTRWAANIESAMTRSPAKRSKRMGRPPGKTYPVAVLIKLKREQAKAIAAYARRGKLSRNEAIRQLIERGLEPQVFR